MDTVIRGGDGLNIDPQITLQGQKYRGQVALLMEDRRKNVFLFVPCRQPVSDVTPTPVVGLRRRSGVIHDQDAVTRLYPHAQGRSVNWKRLPVGRGAQASIGCGLARRAFRRDGGTGTNHAQHNESRSGAKDRTQHS
jgi:hypothetical protein